jgi:hypothetical protein
MKPKSFRASKKQASSLSQSSSLSLLSWLWNEQVEFALIFLASSAIWALIVSKVLDYLKFPYHMHKLEVWLIYLVPVLVIGMLMWLIGSLSTYQYKMKGE